MNDQEKIEISTKGHPTGGKKATSRDIARLCGVSQTTVSYVVNDTPGTNISEKTRQLVLETARRLKYIPNSAARGMRMHRAYSIGVVVGRNVMNIGFNHILKGIKRVSDEAGYAITLLQDDQGQEGYGDAVPQYLAYLRAGRIDGVIFCCCDLEPNKRAILQETGAPYVFADESGVWDGGEEFPDMLREAMTQSIHLCAEKNWRTIRFFSFQYGESLFSRKYNMFAEILAREWPQAVLTRQIIQERGREKSEIEAELLQIIREGGFELAVTPHHRLGIMVQSAIMRKCLQVPQEPKHICLDTAHVLQSIYPSVTCLDIPLTEIGKESGRQMLQMIDGGQLRTVSFTPALVTGASTL